MTRTSQIIKRVRAEAMEEQLNIFAMELVKHVIKKKLTADRVFNMDKTGFPQKNKSKKVIAVHGSKMFGQKLLKLLFT